MHEVRIISCLDIELQLVKLVCFQIWHAALILSKKKKVKQSQLHLLKNSGGTPFSVEKMAFYCSNGASVLLVVSCVTSACRSF